MEGAQAIVIGVAATLFWATTRANLPEAKLRRGLGLAVALTGFGVFVWRLLGLG